MREKYEKNEKIRDRKILKMQNIKSKKRKVLKSATRLEFIKTPVRIDREGSKKQ